MHCIVSIFVILLRKLNIKMLTHDARNILENNKLPLNYAVLIARLVSVRVRPYVTQQNVFVFL